MPNSRLMCRVHINTSCLSLSSVRSKQVVLKQNRVSYSENKAICNKAPIIPSNAVTLSNYKHPVKRTPSPP